MAPDRGDARVASTSPADVSLQGEELRAYVAGGVDAVAELVATTYGPRGLDKVIVVPGDNERDDLELVVTNSGSAVLDAIERGDGFNHPVSAVLVDAVDTMYRDQHDGTTAALLLTRSLLERGHELLEEGLTPSDVAVGYALAAERTGTILDGLARGVTAEDTETLLAVARTALGGRIDTEVADEYATMVVEAVTGLAADGDGDWIDTELVKVVSAPGAETRLHHGVVVCRWPRGAETSDRSLVEFDRSLTFPAPVRDLTVGILDREIDVESTATTFGESGRSGVLLRDMETVSAYREGYDEHRRRLVAGVADLGVDVLVSQPRVDDDLTQLFEASGVAVVDGVETPGADIRRLATASGATVVSRVEDLTAERLGTVGRAREVLRSGEKWTYLTDCPGAAYTVELRVRTERDAGYHRRLVDDALDVVATAVIDAQLLPGAGAPQATVAAGLRDYAAGVSGKEQLAVRAFADALEGTVATLARNAGLDGTDVLTGLRAARERTGTDTLGVDLATGEPGDAWSAGVVEPRRVLSQAIETARTTATQLLQTDAMVYPDVTLGDFEPNTEHD